MNNVVLYCPEIPANTGNIMRTCAAFDFKLHLIKPLGFFLDEYHVKRAGMDYRDFINIKLYDNYLDFAEKNKNGRFVMFTRYGLKSFEECNFKKDKRDIYLIFGKESTGIPKDILRNNIDDAYRLPMKAEARSLNLSNCVAIGAYECLRQQGFPGLAKSEVIKGRKWLLHAK